MMYAAARVSQMQSGLVRFCVTFLAADFAREVVRFPQNAT